MLEVAEGISVAELLESQAITLGPRAAIAVNNTVLRRDSYEYTRLEEDAVVLIINPTFGG